MTQINACFFGCVFVLAANPILADGPADNRPEIVRPIPPPGIEISISERQRLAAKVSELRKALTAGNLPKDLQANVEVCIRAVDLAVEQGLFYDAKDLKRADRLLQLAAERLAKARTSASHRELIGLGREPLEKALPLAGGFVSELDQSVQPYGLVVPAEWKSDDSTPYRLDVWLHGRGEKVLELQFLDQRLDQVGQIAPPRTFVLHPFGRYCNAFKFAGEIDILEAIAHVQRLFPIDERQISIRGFSMGGAGCWQAAVHYPGKWFAANPGAGFSETTEFLKIFQGEAFLPTAAQKKLLHWYDCPGWANNLRLLPTIAYSGEDDRQKQAADVMEAAFEQRDMKLLHVIGPKTGHKIHPDSGREIEQWLMKQLNPPPERVPMKIDFTTYTLRYARNAWIEI